VGDYAACLKKVAACAKGAGLTAGILLRDAADVAPHREMGFALIAVDSDLGLVRKGWQQILAAVESQGVS
jgi:2-keto-3-deoxy-L-rhamnonate aldolase RhmA